MNTLKKDKNAWPWLILSVLIIVVDQFSKYYLNHHLTLGEPVALLPVLNLTLAYNPGAAFRFLGSSGVWHIYILMAISFIISLLILTWLLRTPRAKWLLCLGLSLILGGAIGNLIDRVRLNYVIDFIDFHIGTWHYAIFNLADSAVCIGAVLLVIQMFVKK